MESQVIESSNHPVLPEIEQPDSPISESDRSLLEKMSEEIMAATLPANRLKRIVPDDHTTVENKYPIMSNYRRSTILPDGKTYT